MIPAKIDWNKVHSGRYTAQAWGLDWVALKVEGRSVYNKTVGVQGNWHLLTVDDIEGFIWCQTYSSFTQIKHALKHAQYGTKEYNEQRKRNERAYILEHEDQ